MQMYYAKSQILIVRSLEDDAMYLPWESNEIELTVPMWPFSGLSSCPVSKSQSLMEPSSELVARML